MIAIRLRYVVKVRDRYGATRWYFRRRGMAAVPLPEGPGSAAFMAAYQAALARAEAASARQRVKAAPIAPGSLDALAVSYYASQGHLGLAPSTRRAYRRMLEEMRAKHGSKSVRLLDPIGVRALLGEKAGKPAAMNHRLRLLRTLAEHAVDTGLADLDFTAGVKRVRQPTTGYHSWTEEEIARFEARWPSGSKPRLALALFLYTCQRRSDVVRMGRQSIRDGRWIAVRQQKTRTELLVPIHPALATELDQVPADQMLFLQTDEAGRSKGFSAAGFYQRFVGWAEAAGLPHWSPHGGRKAGLRRLAEAGATDKQLQAISGHRSTKELEPYTRAAEQRRLADAGMDMLPGSGVTQTVSALLRKPGGKT